MLHVAADEPGKSQLGKRLCFSLALPNKQTDVQLRDAEALHLTAPIVKLSSWNCDYIEVVDVSYSSS